MTPHEQHQPEACLGCIAPPKHLWENDPSRAGAGLWHSPALSLQLPPFAWCEFESCVQGFSIITESLHGGCSKSYTVFTRSPSQCALAIILTSSIPGAQDQMACHRRLTRHTEVATEGTTEHLTACAEWYACRAGPVREVHHVFQARGADFFEVFERLRLGSESRPREAASEGDSAEKLLLKSHTDEARAGSQAGRPPPHFAWTESSRSKPCL